MTPFVTLTSVAAPFPEAQIDTDVIFPARFLLLPDKAGLAATSFTNAAPRAASSSTARPGPPHRSSSPAPISAPGPAANRPSGRSLISASAA